MFDTTRRAPGHAPALEADAHTLKFNAAAMAAVACHLRRAAVAACATGLATGLLSARAAAERERDDEYWNEMIKKNAPARSERVDLESVIERGRASRTDQHFLWQTLMDSRRIKRAALFKWLDSDPDRSGRDDFSPTAAPKPGLARYGAIVEVGDEMNGHIGLVHGGFTAALLDDLFGWTAGLEREAQGMPQGTKIFTANLDVNYRRPMPDNAVYYVQAEADRIEKGRKIYLRADVRDAAGQRVVDGSALYIVTRPPPAEARAESFVASGSGEHGDKRSRSS